jgi:polysaccharide pyruvyl transferase WcaK-like protein
MDFGICSRFHSHIFSINNHIPFISLSCTRKVRELLKQNNMMELYCPLITNNDIPLSFNMDETVEKITKILNNSEYYKNKIIDVQLENYNQLIKDFHEKFLD